MKKARIDISYDKERHIPEKISCTATYHEGYIGGILSLEILIDDFE